MDSKSSSVGRIADANLWYLTTDSAKYHHELHTVRMFPTTFVTCRHCFGRKISKVRAHRSFSKVRVPFLHLSLFFHCLLVHCHFHCHCHCHYHLSIWLVTLRLVNVAEHHQVSCSLSCCIIKLQYPRSSPLPVLPSCVLQKTLQVHSLRLRVITVTGLLSQSK